MKSRVLIVATVVLCVCSLGSAEIPVGKNLAGHATAPNAGRINGNIGNLTSSLVQTGALAADLNINFDTGSVSPAYSPYYAEDAFYIIGQIYDYPWRSTYNGTTWVNTNDFVSTGLTILGGDNGPYAHTYSFTVPVADTYQGWVRVYGGWYPGLPWSTTNNSGFWWSQVMTDSSVNTTYVDAVQPTDNPDAGGQPIPTMNRWGILAMIGMLLGVAVLVIIRRK